MRSIIYALLLLSPTAWTAAAATPAGIPPVSPPVLQASATPAPVSVAGELQRLGQLQNQARATSDDKQLASMAMEAAAIETQADQLVATREAAAGAIALA